MLVGLLGTLQLALREVHAVWVLLQLQEYLFRRGGTIDEWSPEALQASQVVAVNMAEKTSEGQRLAW